MAFDTVIRPESHIDGQGLCPDSVEFMSYVADSDGVSKLMHCSYELLAKVEAEFLAHHQLVEQCLDDALFGWWRKEEWATQ